MGLQRGAAGTVVATASSSSSSSSSSGLKSRVYINAVADGNNISSATGVAGVVDSTGAVCALIPAHASASAFALRMRPRLSTVSTESNSEFKTTPARSSLGVRYGATDNNDRNSCDDGGNEGNIHREINTRNETDSNNSSDSEG